MEKYNTTYIDESNELSTSVISLSRIIVLKNEEIEKLREELESANNSSQFWYKKSQELEGKLKEMTGEDEEEPEYNDKSKDSD